MERKIFWIMLCMGISLLCGAKEKLAVVDFAENGRIKVSQAGKIVANLFGAALSDKYILLERMQINKIITEQRFSLSDLVGNKSKAKRLGKLLGADKLVVGNVSALGNTVTVDARVVDVSSGKWSERAYIYCSGIGEIPKNLPTLLAKMRLLGNGGVSIPMPVHASGPLSYRSQTFAKYLSVGHAKLRSGDLETARAMAMSASKVPGYKHDRNVKFLRQLIKQEEKRRHEEAVAKGFKFKVDAKLKNSSSPLLFKQKVEGRGIVKMAVIMRKNNLYIRIDEKSVCFDIKEKYEHGETSAVAECEKFKVLADIVVCGERIPIKVLYSNGRYRTHIDGKPFTRFRLDAFKIVSLQGIRKDLY